MSLIDVDASHASSANAAIEVSVLHVHELAPSSCLVEEWAGMYASLTILVDGVCGMDIRERF